MTELQIKWQESRKETKKAFNNFMENKTAFNLCTYKLAKSKKKFLYNLIQNS